MLVKLLEPLGIPIEMVEDFKDELNSMGHDFEYYDEKTNDYKEMAERCKNADIIMIANNPFPREVVESLEDTKLINIAFTGFDHVAVKEAFSKGIDISNASGYSDIAVSEIVIGLVLDLYRNISALNSEIRKSGMPIPGREIRGKNVGIIGTGNIGIETAKLFKAFGANLYGYDISEKEEFSSIGNYLNLDDLLKKSDILSIHLPVNEKTERFLGEREFRLMKDTALLINCARGKIIDNDALANALNEGIIAGAGIDVYDMEPPIPKDYPILKAKNAILTPHIAYLTKEAMIRRAKIAFDNTISYINGEAKNLIEHK
ncbi:MAG: NAD(P)-dependent oxidoreductase [Tissierellia bacterium]|nr:NAD(P)-dependent oxidoreductase [Tissierellia bacterium]